MAVPSHDQRDFEYAIAHNIDMIQVIDGTEEAGIWTYQSMPLRNRIISERAISSSIPRSLQE